MNLRGVICPPATVPVCGGGGGGVSNLMSFAEYYDGIVCVNVL